MMLKQPLLLVSPVFTAFLAWLLAHKHTTVQLQIWGSVGVPLTKPAAVFSTVEPYLWILPATLGLVAILQLIPGTRWTSESRVVATVGYVFTVV